MDDAELDECLRALAHPVRRQIIRLTSARRLSAGDIADAVGVAPATASEHLKVLRKNGFVVLTAEGTWRYYEAAAGRVSQVQVALSAHLPSRIPTEENT